jgi:pyridoxal phosphate enzyme (YggS family)
MAVQTANYQQIRNALDNTEVTLVAVSKTKPIEDIQILYDLGQRDFGENYVQEIQEKYPVLPKDIRWHFIGHVQSNKVKYIAPYVFMIHGVDSYSLLREINKQALKNNRVIRCLLQVYVAKEETKFGLDEQELAALLENLMASSDMKNVSICGLMAMASFTDNLEQVRQEFKTVKSIFNKMKAQYFQDSTDFQSISMGMSNDYAIAIEEGSTIIRVGSKLFGSR